MLLASELKGELARIHPARECCRRAELAGLLHGQTASLHPRSGRTAAVDLVTLEPATARTAVQLAASIRGVHDEDPAAAVPRGTSSGRRRLRVTIEASAVADWSWMAAPACDRRAFLRGVLLRSGSISVSTHGLHVEFVFRSAARAAELRRRLAESDVRASLLRRRGRAVVYIKGRDELATLLRLTGANRGLLDLETSSVGREVRNRLNRLLNAEEANLGRTVAAAERQAAAIETLTRAGRLESLSGPLRETVATRRRLPDADLDQLARALGVSRSAVNHRLRRVVALASAIRDEAETSPPRGSRTASAARRR